MDQDQLNTQLQEIAASGKHLDKPDNIYKAMNHGKYITAAQLKIVDKAKKASVVNAMFLKNDIFAYIYTSEAHELHKASEQKLLQTATPNTARALIGDASASLEERLQQLKEILLKGETTNQKTVSNAGAIYGMIGSLDILRQKMAENFPEQKFLDKSADKKLVDQPKL